MAKKPTTPKTTESGVKASAVAPAENPAVKPAVKKSAKALKAPARVKAVAVTKPDAAGASITPADIALRAYFIAEKRLKLGLRGDSTSDWVEAERQLKAEAAK